MSKTVQEFYEERKKRVTDVIALRRPDRIPVTASFSFFPARYCGYTFADMMYDPDKIWEAIKLPFPLVPAKQEFGQGNAAVLIADKLTSRD